MVFCLVGLWLWRLGQGLDVQGAGASLPAFLYEEVAFAFEISSGVRVACECQLLGKMAAGSCERR